MASVKCFEELDAWQKARRMAGAIYVLTKEAEFGRDFGLRDQIRRSAVSVMANIAEGFERKSDKDFLRFLRIASGSLAETRSHLIIACDVGYLRADQLTEILQLVDETGKLTKGLARYLDSPS